MGIGNYLKRSGPISRQLADQIISPWNVLDDTDGLRRLSRGCAKNFDPPSVTSHSKVEPIQRNIAERRRISSWREINKLSTKHRNYGRRIGELVHRQSRGTQVVLPRAGQCQQESPRLENMQQGMHTCLAANWSHELARSVLELK